MPKPFKGGFSYGGNSLAQRPKLAAHVGIIASFWTQVELELGYLLAHILQANADVATAMYIAIRSSGPKRDAMIAAAGVSLTPNLFQEFESLLDSVHKVSKQRDEVIHAEWGLPSLDYKNQETILLMDPKKGIAFKAAMISHNPQKDPTRLMNSLHDRFHTLLEYSEDDFIQIESNITEKIREIYKFRQKIALLFSSRNSQSDDQTVLPSDNQNNPSETQ